MMVRTLRWFLASVIAIAAVLIATQVDPETIRSICLGTFVVLGATSIVAGAIVCAVQSGWRYGVTYLVLAFCESPADWPTSGGKVRIPASHDFLEKEQEP